MTWRSAWPIFHGPLILPCILKTIWCINITLLDYESVWRDVWPQNKCRSLWPIFHGPVILPYILKTVWCMNILLRNYESVWPDARAYKTLICYLPDIWPKNKCRSLWPIFHGPVILPYILKTVWCMNILLRNYESVWPDARAYKTLISTCRTFDLKINVGHCDLYFMVQWFCLIFWRLVDVLWPIFHGPVILPNIFKNIQWLNIIRRDYESVWPDIWPPNICRSLWPIFHSPLNLPFILKTDIWTSYFQSMSQYDTTFDLEINVGHCDLYFMVQWFCLIS